MRLRSLWITGVVFLLLSGATNAHADFSHSEIKEALRRLTDGAGSGANFGGDDPCAFFRKGSQNQGTPIAVPTPPASSPAPETPPSP